MTCWAKIGFTLWILMGAVVSIAQPVSLHVVCKDTLIKSYRQDRIFTQPAALEQFIQEELIRWRGMGYWSASFDAQDTSKPDSLKRMYHFSLGHAYAVQLKWAQNGQPLPVSDPSVMETILRSLEQQGYPFARITLQGSPLTSPITLSIQIDSGSYITYDTLQIAGTATQDPEFLMRYLNIRPGRPYDERSITLLEEKLRQLPYLKVKASPAVVFYQDKAKVILYLDDKAADSFQGLAGIRADERNTGRYHLYGDVNLSLTNVLEMATALKLQWHRYATQNSDLQVSLSYPYILGAPWACSDEFILFRQDSNFQRLKNHLGVSYLFRGMHAMQAYYAYEQSYATLTTAQKQEALSSENLPQVNDYINRHYGFRFHYATLDQMVLTTKGMLLDADLNTGTHTVVPNAALRDARDAGGRLYAVYDSINLRSTLWQAALTFDGYHPLTKRHVLNLYVEGATLNHPRILYNEQFQLGGYRSFRGVNELSIKATTYALVRTEYHYVLPQTGYFSLFCNAMYYESRLVQQAKSKSLIGFGAGMGLQTGAGVLHLVYAMSNADGLVFRNGKIHLGLTTIF